MHMNGKNPLIPMAAITGRPDRAQMERTLRAYRSVGIEQFLIYPRSGMEYEYMSLEWLRICRDIVEIAAELDMHIWLYDEYNWPSGNCFGQVTAGHEEYYPNALTFSREGDAITAEVTRTRVGADILNPDAVARFIQLTHQRYYDAFPEYFGTVVKGIFTDEPSFAYFSVDTSGLMVNASADDRLRLAWYDGLEADYAARCGGDFRADVMAHMNGQTPALLWETYYRLMGDRMREVFVGGMRRWCDEHGIVLTGHMMDENAPTSIQYNGDPLKMLGQFSLPGMDEISTHVDLSAPDGHVTMGSIEFSAMSVCQYAGRDKPGQLAELFALGPADLPMGVMRQMIWLTACYGVDHYVLAVAALDPKGNIEKGQYYFPTSETAPWFEHYAQLAQSAAEAAKAARKPFVPCVRLRYPTTQFMRMIKRPECAALRELYLSMFDALVTRQIPYLYIREDETTELPVISLDDRGLLIEGEPERYVDAGALADRLLKVIHRPCVVFDADGSETRNLMVRTWADGTVTLVSLHEDDASDRLVTIKGDAGERTVRLTGRAVFNGSLDGSCDALTEAASELPLESFRLTLEKDNLLRCVYTKAAPEFRFTLTEPMALRVLLRREPEAVEARLDGENVIAEESNDVLTEGFRPLYRATAPIMLAAGEHCLTITNDVMDHRYFPSAFLSGAFLMDENGALMPLADGYPANLGGYTGSWRLSAAVELPAGARVAADANSACTELFADGKSLGKRCWAPYEWTLPDGAQELTLRLTTPILPMFGDIDRLSEEQPIGGWIHAEPGHYSESVLRRLSILK